MQHFYQAEILHASYCCVITAIFTKNPNSLVTTTLFLRRQGVYSDHKHQKCLSKLNFKPCRSHRVMHVLFAEAALPALTVPAALGIHQPHPTAAIVL